MATSEALVKYYDCLRDSFTKIQDKNNETALVNAALRPKIRDEFAKSRNVLDSYLNYIRVFSIIYSDKFPEICSNILAPLLKDSTLLDSEKEPDANVSASSIKSDTLTQSIHDTFKVILESKPDLVTSFVTSIVRVFPNLNEDDYDESQHEAFRLYFINCISICTYLDQESAQTLLAKMLEKINPPKTTEQTNASVEVVKTLKVCYDILYESLDSFDEKESEKFVSTLLKAFTQDFIAYSHGRETLNHIVLYACSLNSDFVDELIGLLWDTFTNSSKSNEERHASIDFIGSFMARANYITIDYVINYLESATNWCNKFIEENSHKALDIEAQNENLEAFYALTQSIFYLMSQRYREMYEQDTISRLQALNFEAILDCYLNPLKFCEPELRQRFLEVVSLYEIASPKISTYDDAGRIKKRRKSERDNRTPRKLPFQDVCDSLPKKIEPIYRNYYDHRNFTVYRE